MPRMWKALQGMKASPQFGYRAIDAWNLAALGACLLFLLRMAGRRWPMEVEDPVRGLCDFHAGCGRRASPGADYPCGLRLLCAALYLFSRSPRPASGGIAIGLALAKFTLSAPFLAILAYRRKWRAFLIALAIFAALNIAFSTPGGITATMGSFRAAVARENRPGTSYDPVSSNPTYMPNTLVHGKRLLYLVLGARRPLIDWLNITVSLVIAAVMIYVMRVERRVRGAITEPLGSALLTWRASSIYHRTYDLAALLLFGYALVEEGVRGPDRRTPAWSAMIVIFLLVTHSARIVYSLARWYPAGASASAILCWSNCLALVALFLLCAMRLNTVRKQSGDVGQATKSGLTKPDGPEGARRRGQNAFCPRRRASGFVRRGSNCWP